MQIAGNLEIKERKNIIILNKAYKERHIKQ